MALLDLAVYFDFKFFFAVASLALHAQALTNCVFVPFYRHYISAVGTAYFFGFCFCGLHLSISFQKTLAIHPILWYTKIIKHAREICLL